MSFQGKFRVLWIALVHVVVITILLLITVNKTFLLNKTIEKYFSNELMYQHLSYLTALWLVQLS